MTVSTIASIAAGIGRTLGNQNAKVASSVKSLVTGSRLTSASVDVSSLATATALQSQTSSLRVATQNVAQAAALVRVADGGATEITRALGRLKDISLRASSGDLSNGERAALDVEFQSLRSTINRIATNSSFDGRTLLDGSLTSESLQVTSDGEEGFAVGSLTDEALFSQGADVLTADNAKAAYSAVQDAISYVTEQQATLGALGEGLDFAFASIESAVQNQEAARSMLSDADFAEVATESQQAQVQAQSTAALLAQTNKLPANVLALLAE